MARWLKQALGAQACHGSDHVCPPEGQLGVEQERVSVLG